MLRHRVTPTVVLIIALTVTILLTEIVNAETQSFLVFHGTRTLKGNFGIGGWSIFPNIIPSTKNLILIGPRYAQDNCWIELLWGKLALPNGNSSSLVSMRALYDNLPFSTNLWGQIQFFPKDQTLFWFLEMNYPIKINKTLLCVVGVETENIHNINAPDSLGFGPHVVVPLGKMALIGTYQWRKGKENNFLRFSTVINF